MEKKQKIKIIIDVCMTIALLCLMSYELIGTEAHEWIGIAMFFLFIIHHFLNRKWITRIFKGKYTPFRIVQTFLTVAILFFMLGSMISGVILSNYVFAFVKIKGVAIYARKVHMLCGYWGFVCMSLHLGLHWGMMMGMLKKRMCVSENVAKQMMRLAGCLIAGYGIYAFIKRDIGTYMLLKTEFVLFNYDEPLIFFFLDYLAVMGLFVFIAYYIADFMKKINTGRKKN